MSESETGVRRVRRVRPYAAMFFIALGMFVWGVELVLHWLDNRPIGGGPILLGSIVAFVGFYMIDHADAKDGAGFVVDKTITLIDRTVTLIRTVRGGRASDPAGTIVETKITAPVVEKEEQP